MTEPTSILLTDLYQLTTLQAYFDQQMNDTAVFEFFVRKLPPGRNFLVAAGLEQVLDFLADLHFSDAELAWMKACGRFTSDFVESLRHLKFTGDVHAMPEGTVCFANEPILRITAPLSQAQLVETRVINLLQFQTMVASKAARVRLAAPNARLVDFGLRRAHGAEAGLYAARAGFLVGLDGTSNVLAGMRWGIPLYGTMSHSFVQSHDSEATAFEHFAQSYPEASTLLIDTYDIETATRSVVSLSKKLQEQGIRIQAVRLDSGNLSTHAHAVRRILDQGGCKQVDIFASGNLDEYKLADLSEAEVPINGFGVGTLLITSADQPYLDCAYKLQEYGGLARRKHSEDKATWPGRKQVYRHYGPDGMMSDDVLTTEEGEVQGKALLMPMVRKGQRLHATPSLQAVRKLARDGLSRLPPSLRSVVPALAPYRVNIHPCLVRLAAEVDKRIAQDLLPRKAR